MSKDLKVSEYIREQVPDWNDEVKATARFKSFSGQRSDWDPQFRFWRDLIINIARRFRLLFLCPSQMKSCWFNRGGLMPLCLDDVLLEMYKAGDLLRMTDLGDPTRGRFSQLLKKMIHLSSVFRSSTSNDILNDRLILPMILEDKANDVIKALSESQWTSSCIITKSKFESLFKEQNEAYAVLSYLSGLRRAKYVSVKKKQLVEGVKLSLSSAVASNISSLDFDILQLVWTSEELQQQLDAIDKHYERSKKSACAALRSGNQKGALRIARQLKMVSGNREKLASFLNRVETVLQVITDAESTKKVSEAMQIGARAIKETRMNVKEVQSCMLEIDELMDAQAELHKALESTPYDAAEEEDLEEELQKLESQIRDENFIQTSDEFGEDVGGNSGERTADSLLSEAMSGLKIEDVRQGPRTHSSVAARNHPGVELEAAWMQY